MTPESKPNITKPAPLPPTKGGSTDLPARRTPTCKRYGKIDLPMRLEYQPEWRAILRDAGYPTDVVVIDFETYFDSDYSLRGDKLSTVEFIKDDRFESLGVSVLEVNAPFDDYESRTKFWSGEDGTNTIIDHLKRQYGRNLERCTVVAQNAQFDCSILSFRYDILPPYVVDVLGLARHWNSRTRNDLGSLCKRWGLVNKGETTDFKEATFRKRYKKPKASRKKGPKIPKPLPRITSDTLRALSDYANNDVMREWELFCLLLPLMSRPNFELRAMQHTLELFWNPCLRVDQEKGRELTAQMDQRITDACEAASVTREEVSKDSQFEPLLDKALVWAGDDPAKFQKPAKNTKGWKFAIAKDDPEREKLENHEDQYVRLLIEARNAVKSWPLHIKRVNRISKQSEAVGGYLPVPLKYHGAATGRWSGGEKINLQNLGSRGDPLISAVRNMIVASENDTLVIADASQIEARVLAWVAGQDDLLQQFANGDDVYCAMAEDIVGHRVRKPKPSDPDRIALRMASARFKGKVAVLGGGYGMGPDKYTSQYGLSNADAKTIVDVYRRKNDKIAGFWPLIENAFKYTYKYGKPCSLPCGVRFDQIDNCDVLMTIPSGREIKYHTVRINQDKYGESVSVWNDQSKSWVHIWGGFLTENLVQAISRDILWEAIERLEEHGHHVALHCHDEIIIPTSADDGVSVLNGAIEELSRCPAWAAGIPLAAEGTISNRYKEH